MEPEGPLRCSHEPTAGPCPETDEFSPYHLIQFLKDSFEYCPPTYI
jgi:hypothetical protein